MPMPLHHATPSFWQCYEKLPESVRELADRNYALLRENPRHPSLHFKRIKADLWSVRVGSGYRALATNAENAYLWFWIGTHGQYDFLIGQ